jgi:hypothetical protein
MPETLDFCNMGISSLLSVIWVPEHLAFCDMGNCKVLKAFMPVKLLLLLDAV